MRPRFVAQLAQAARSATAGKLIKSMKSQACWRPNCVTFTMSKSMPKYITTFSLGSSVSEAFANGQFIGRARPTLAVFHWEEIEKVGVSVVFTLKPYSPTMWGLPCVAGLIAIRSLEFGLCRVRAKCNHAYIVIAEGLTIPTERIERALFPMASWQACHVNMPY